MATPSNRFAKVTAPSPDAVTVILRQEGGATLGQVEGPAIGADADRPALSFGRDGRLGAQEALAVGCQLANELGRDVVVIDEGNHWSPAWGRLESR